MGELVRSEEKRRIGIFVHMQPDRGGSYQYVEFILDAFASCLDQYDVEVVYVEEGWGEILEREYPFFSSRQIAFRYDCIADDLDSLGFDYLFLPTYGVDHYFELAFKTPLISVIHDLMYYYQPRGSMWTCKESSYLYQGQCRHSVGVFVDSELGKQHCLEALGHMYESKLYVLPFRAPNYLYKDEMRKVELNNSKYIFYPAQLFRLKNHINLLLAVYQLKRKGIYVNLLFTGKGRGEYENLCDFIRVLNIDNQIEIIDYQDGPEMKYLFAHARAAVMASYAGPTNIPPIEAMYMGCPIAVSDVFAMPEQVGEAGLCFDPRSAEDIANTLERLWMDDDLCQRMAALGRTQVAKLFSKEIFNQRFRDSMEKMIIKYEQDTACLRELTTMCRKYSKIFLYGAGEIGFWIGSYLKAIGMENLCGYVVSKRDRDREERFLDIPVHEVADMKGKLKGGLVILSLSPKHHEEVAEILADMGNPDTYAISARHRIEAWTYYMKTH